MLSCGAFVAHVRSCAPAVRLGRLWYGLHVSFVCVVSVEVCACVCVRAWCQCECLAACIRKLIFVSTFIQVRAFVRTMKMYYKPAGPICLPVGEGVGWAGVAGVVAV